MLLGVFLPLEDTVSVLNGTARLEQSRHLPESKRLLADAMTALCIEHDMERAEMLSAKLQQQHPGKEDTQIWIGQACQAEGKPLHAMKRHPESEQAINKPMDRLKESGGAVTEFRNMLDRPLKYSQRVRA